MDDGLSVKDIAAISTSSKLVFAIHTGPFTGLHNVDTYENVRKIFLFCDAEYYNHPKFENRSCITHIPPEEIHGLLQD